MLPQEGLEWDIALLPEPLPAQGSPIGLRLVICSYNSGVGYVKGTTVSFLSIEEELRLEANGDKPWPRVLCFHPLLH